MPRKQVPIFATQNDLLKVIGGVDAVRPLMFVTAGLFDQSVPQISDDLLPLTSYLVVDKGLKIAVRPIQQRRGGSKYAVDQLTNPDSVVLSTGGTLDADRLLAGQMGTASESEISTELYTLFAKSVHRHFQRIKSYYVGPEAVRLLDEGMRLMPTESGPPSYDLTR
jgi:hypothetical protein